MNHGGRKFIHFAVTVAINNTYKFISIENFRRAYGQGEGLDVDLFFHDRPQNTAFVLKWKHLIQNTNDVSLWIQRDCHIQFPNVVKDALRSLHNYSNKTTALSLADRIMKEVEGDYHMMALVHEKSKNWWYSHESKTNLIKVSFILSVYI